MISWLASDYFQQSPVLFAPIIGLLVFMTMFCGIAIYAWRLDPKEINELSNLPLDSEEDNG